MKFPEPVTHEFGCHFHVSDLELYNVTDRYYSRNVRNSNDHYVQLGNREFKFWRKRSGLVDPKTKKLAFEHVLHWKDKRNAGKCSYTIKPLFGAGTKTKNGKILNLPSVGTQIHIQSSYIDLDEHYDIIFDFMDFLGVPYLKNKIDRKKSFIYQMARYIRYHERCEHVLVTVLQAIEQGSSMLGDTKLVKIIQSGNYNMYKLDNPNYSVCGLHPQWEQGVKSYRINNFLQRVPEDPLRHPKLEVFLKPKSHKNPSISEYLDLKKDLDRVLYSLLSFLNEPIEYVNDSYFNNEKIYEYRYNLPKWNSRNQALAVFHLSPDTNIKAVKVLAYIALESEGCADFRDILESTEIPERTLWRYINHWKMKGLLDTVKEKRTKVFFLSKSLFEQAKQSLITFCSTFSISFKKLPSDVFIDSGVIRPRTSSNKNREPTLPNNSNEKNLIVVDNYRQGRSLLREFKEEGINCRVAVLSSHTTKRNSRVY